MNVGILRGEPDVQSVATGEAIFDVGDPADVMYGVVEGAISIQVDGRELERCEPGHIFGEMAIIDGSPRSARAVAATASKVARIDERRFRFLVQQTPNFALDVMRVLAQRLRRQSRSNNG